MLLFASLIFLLEHVYFCDFYNSPFHFCRLLFPCSQTYCVDDGFSSYRAFQDFIVFNRYVPDSRLLRRSRILTNFYLQDLSFIIHYLPTIFLLIRMNYLSSSRTAIVYRQTSGNERFSLLFIGTKLSERGAISLEQKCL